MLQNKNKMKTYAILGFPLGHSYSPQYFNDRFKREGVNAEFIKLEKEKLDTLRDLIKDTTSLYGFCVTIPHKQNIIPFLDSISKEAKEIGAVNCVEIKRNKEGEIFLYGHNTDVLGFKNSLLQFIKKQNIEKALILGNGGAAHAVRYALNSLKIENLTVSRKPKNKNEITYNKVGELISSYKLIINTTPLGTSPNTDFAPEIPYNLLTEDHYLYDLIYNPVQTKFMRLGKNRGAQVCNGYSMLIGQAEENWNIWHPQE